MALKLPAREVAEQILDIPVKDLGLKPAEHVPDHRLKGQNTAQWAAILGMSERCA